MTSIHWLLAQRGPNSPANKWLNENPAVLGLIAIGIGILLIFAGLNNLRTGVTRNKLGMEFRGGIAQFSGILRVLIGVAACGFGLYKIFAG
ncbi:MAG: hypothetical protein HY290_09200 [Planctomycetia bacterium]|nr:hypothetical protein [Planctomycetia bacterium]